MVKLTEEERKRRQENERIARQQREAAAEEEKRLLAVQKENLKKKGPGFLDLGPPPEERPTQTIIGETGRPVGIVTPEGKTFLGLPRESVEQLQAKAIGRGGRVVEAEEFAAEEREIARQEEEAAALKQEKQRLVSEELPRQVQLNPPIGTETSGIPIIGAIQVGVRALPFFEDVALTPDETLSAARQEIQRKEFENGLTLSERMGALIESIPGAVLLSKLGEFETPRSNLEEVFGDIKSMRRRLQNIETNVKLGDIPVEVAKDQIKDIEDYIIQQEARLKLLIINSPSLRFNSDRVNSFETDIITVKEKVFQAKLNILRGIELDPDAMAIFLKQQEQDTVEWSAESWS